MITTIFSKSRPFNYFLIILMLSLCYFAFQHKEINLPFSSYLIIKKVIILLILIGSLFLSNFITKKNNLTKNNSFTILFFFSFLILLPNNLENHYHIIANFFVLLALRRLISLQSLITPKEKIFDASLFIFVAALFHFWSILFIVLVFFSIILHISRDYRNWLLPFIAFFTIGIIACLIATLKDYSLINFVSENAAISFNFNYFSNIYQNIGLSIYAAIVVLFLFNMLISLSNKPLNTQNSYKKIVLSFLLGILIYVMSPNKSNSILIFTFMPMSLMATVYFEDEPIKWKKETTAILVLGLCFLMFFLQI